MIHDIFKDYVSGCIYSMNIYNLKEESTVFEELGYCMDTPERFLISDAG